MKKNIIEFFEKLNISENEAKLYLTLNANGAMSVGALAKKLSIPRSTAYTYVADLIDKGVVMKLVSGSESQVAAISPDEILPFLVNQKLQTGQQLHGELPQILENIQSEFPSQNIKNVDDAQSRFYKGKLGVKKVYKETLEAKEVRSYANLEEIEKFFPENFQLFDDALTNNPELEMFEIIEETPFAKEKSEISIQNANKRYHYKFLPKDKKLTSTDILIYDGNVAFINLKDEITCVVVRNADLYNNFKLLFNTMWDLLPEIKR